MFAVRARVNSQDRYPDGLSYNESEATASQESSRDNAYTCVCACSLACTHVRGCPSHVHTCACPSRVHVRAHPSHVHVCGCPSCTPSFIGTLVCACPSHVHVCVPVLSSKIVSGHRHGKSVSFRHVMNSLIFSNKFETVNTTLSSKAP